MNLLADRAMAEALYFLAHQQNADGSIACDNDARFKIWETAISLLALQADARYEALRTCSVDFLERVRRNDGSFPHSTRPAMLDDHENYCTETTATATVALIGEGRNVSSSVMFLLNRQMPDGSWDAGIKGLRSEVRRYVSVTGHALRALLKAETRGEPIAHGIQYLEMSREPDGLWGSLLEAYDSPHYAAYVIADALHLAGRSHTPLFCDVMRATVQGQQRDGSWGGMTGADRPSVALKTTLALNTLLASPTAAEIDAIKRGVSWLLAHQASDGRWHGGLFGPHETGKCEDVFATAMAIIAFVQYHTLFTE